MKHNLSAQDFLIYVYIKDCKSYIFFWVALYLISSHLWNKRDYSIFTESLQNTRHSIYGSVDFLRIIISIQVTWSFFFQAFSLVSIYKKVFVHC